MSVHNIECLHLFLSVAFELYLYEASEVFATSLYHISLTLLTVVSTAIPALDTRENQSQFHAEYTTGNLKKKEGVAASEEKTKFFC